MNHEPLHWDFPLPRNLTGVPVGNGTMGLMVWGEHTLCITIARAGFWIHPDASATEMTATYEKVRRAVTAGDEESLRSMFPAAESARPFQLGGGRLEIPFADGWQPHTARVHPPSGILVIELKNQNDQTRTLRLGQSRRLELAWVEGLQGSEKIELRPAWDFLEEELKPFGITAPERWDGKDGGGFLQSMPQEAGLAVGWTRQGNRLLIGTRLGGGGPWEAPSQSAIDDEAEHAEAWWEEYWAATPALELPDKELQAAYETGLYRQAGLTPPEGVAASLQGPWMEDDRIPPWSNDYHFNINVQLIYGPALPTNRAAHFQPLWNMLREWMPALKRTGEAFFERPGALMLPHAVDDRCGVVGSFWTGTIDHACTAWMAYLAWQQYLFTQDEKVLREVALPLLIGAFEGYWAMLEKIEGATPRMHFPLSVSPEYGASSMEACGANASFQLAACHAVIGALGRAADFGHIERDPRWEQVAAGLPPYQTIGEPPRIAIWEGQDLAESHRHHSHLAGIWPFRTLDPHAEHHWEIVGRSIQHWADTGAGKWSGWCVPWAAILCSRCGLPDAAVAWLKWGLQLFTNVGGATLHDTDFVGAGGLGDRKVLAQRGFPPSDPMKEIMQMDAAMANITAILELLVRCREDEIVVLDRIPQRWRSFRFRGIRTEGAFLVDAEVRGGRVKQVRVFAEKGGTLRIRPGLPAGSLVTSREGSFPMKAESVELHTQPGETVVFQLPD